MRRNDSKIILGEKLHELGKRNKNLVHVTADGSISPQFCEAFPQRYFDVGIAESNLIGISSGLAYKGKTVVINGITAFVLTNSYLFLRNLVCKENLNVIILGIGTGFTYSKLGFSHHALEDIGLLNTLPKMKVYLPADVYESVASFEDAVKRGGPAFIRVELDSDSSVYKEKSAKLIKFEGPMVMREGEDITILSTGICTKEALVASNRLEKEFSISAQVINLNSLNLYNYERIGEYLPSQTPIVVVEEHYEDSGIGMKLLSSLERKIKILGVKKEFTDFTGSRKLMLRHYNIDCDSICAAVIKLLRGSK